MVSVKGGCFEMGNTFKRYFSNEQPAHEVCVGEFSIGRYEVTQKEWSALMDRNHSHFKGCEMCPVENVSWDTVQVFIEKLNEKTGGSYRLPTEAEWEYAARSGGRKEQWPGTNEKGEIGEYIFYHGYARDRTHPVGLKKPNALGLYDMSGNISEWVSDWFGRNYYKESPGKDPRGPETGKVKVHRGGSWDVPCPERVRTTRRRYDWPGNWENFIGFRLAHPAGRPDTASAEPTSP